VARGWRRAWLQGTELTGEGWGSSTVRQFGGGGTPMVGNSHDGLRRLGVLLQLCARDREMRGGSN
jgi:hypothetical protein